MPLYSFCGLLTLQVGVAILAAVFLTLSGIIMAANIFDYYQYNLTWPLNLILMILFVLGLLLAGLFMFISSYSESRSSAMASLVVITVLLCYWIILCCFSFVSSRSHVDAVCIETRCPETFWIANLYWRRYHYNHWYNPNFTTTTTIDPYFNPYFYPHYYQGEYRLEDEGVEHQFEDGHRLTRSNPEISGLTQANGYELANGWISLDRYDSTSMNKTDKKLFHSSNLTNAFDPPIQAGLLLKNIVVFLGSDRGNFTNQRRTTFENKSEHYMLKHISGDISNKSGRAPLGKREILELLDGVANLNSTTAPPVGSGDTDHKWHGSRYTFGLPMLGAIFLFVVNLLFLIFSALVMWSWASELDWADYYVEDEPATVVYED